MSDIPLLGISIDPDSPVPLFEQLYLSLRKRIINGQLTEGDRLPASRKLADELGVSRTTIVSAYDQLIDEGFANACIGSGVYISQIGRVEQLETPSAPRPSPEPVSSTSRPWPFYPGHPDERLFPWRQWAKSVARVARNEPERLLLSDEAFGDTKLRYEICRYLTQWRGVKATPEQVLITAGAGDSLKLCLQTLLAPNDAIALEDPGYPPLYHYVRQLGLRHTFMSMDNKGALPPEPKTSAGSPRLAVLTPSSQFPLGGAMPHIRRNEFIEWATQNQGWIIEDDYDSEFRYAGRPIPALAGLDNNLRTLYVGTFSKVFSSGLRIGYIVLPPTLVAKFSSSVQNFGYLASAVPQAPLADFMRNGEFYRHIRRTRRIYAERRSTFISLLDRHLGDLVSYENHRAGMHMVIQFPPEYNDSELYALAKRVQIACSPLSRYYVASEKRQGLLMGFCGHTADEMTAAMIRFKSSIFSAEKALRVFDP